MVCDEQKDYYAEECRCDKQTINGISQLVVSTEKKKVYSREYLLMG